MLIVTQDYSGRINVFERIDDSHWNRVTYRRRSIQMVAPLSHRSGLKGLVLALGIWLLRDSAVSGYHWLLALLLSN